MLFGESGGPARTTSPCSARCSLAQATEFVDKLPGKLDAPIAQAGANVSGGQKQRLSIARALARKPEILIFDDSFSALDYRTDASLRAGLARELSDTTCLIVAQRIGTIRHADRIVVLDEGRVAGHRHARRADEELQRFTARSPCRSSLRQSWHKRRESDGNGT